MASLMETLFGPDAKPGGQPGLVGKAGNAVWNGTGELPEGAGFLETLGKSLGNIPHMLTDIAVKNPLEILKNPASALNDRGEVSLTRLLFPDFRRETVKQDQQRAKVRDAYAQAQVVNTYEKLVEGVFGQPGAQSAEEGMAAGLPPAEAERAAQRDAQGEEQLGAARSAAQKFGLPEEMAGFVTPDNALSTYNTLTDTKRAEDAAAKAEARAARAEGRANTRLSLATKRAAQQASGVAAPGRTTGAERQGQADVKMLKRLLRKGQVTEDLKPEAREAVRAKSGRQAYNILSQTIGTQRTSSPAQIMSNPAFREASDRKRAAEAARGGLVAAERAAMTPDGAGIDPTLFSPAMAALLPDSAWGQSVALGLLDDQQAARKQNLISTNAKNLGDYVLRMTGKVSNVNELERLKTVGPTGNEASGLLYQTKIAAFDRALQREAEIAARESEAIGSGMQSGDWRSTLITSDYEASVRELAEDLAEAEQDAGNQPDGPLTPEELAEMEKYRANR
jgi:hypothetical protein